MIVRSQCVVFCAEYMYVSIKKQYLEMSCNNVKTFWKSFVCLFGLGSNTLFVKVVFWKGSKSYLTSLLIHEYIIDVWHQTWCLPLLWHLDALFHFSVGIRYEHPAWPGTDSHELQKCFFFLFCFMVSYTYSSLWHLQS